MPNPHTPRSFHRYMVAVYLFFSFYVGLLLTLLPWVPWVWEKNYFLYTFPALQSVVLNPFFRGLISGLGLLNVIAGIEEAVHQHQLRKSRSRNPN